MYESIKNFKVQRTKYSGVDEVNFVEESLKDLKGYGLLKQAISF